MKRIRDNLGKTLTIFLVVISVLLLSLTVITLFFFQKENELRVDRERELQEVQGREATLQNELKEAKKQQFLLEEKIKEADEKINGLLDDLELEEGLREEMKNESLALKDAVSKSNEEKDKLRQELEGRLKKAKDEYSDLFKRFGDLEDQNQELEAKVAQLQEYLEQALMAPSPEPVEKSSMDVIELEKNEVNVHLIPEAKVLSIDESNKFIIFDQGKNAGVVEGLVMSVFRGDKYLGDIRTSRIQDEMSAADVIPPLSIRKIRKNDRIIIKQ